MIRCCRIYKCLSETGYLHQINVAVLLTHLETSQYRKAARCNKTIKHVQLGKQCCSWSTMCEFYEDAHDVRYSKFHRKLQVEVHKDTWYMGTWLKMPGPFLLSENTIHEIAENLDEWHWFIILDTSFDSSQALMLLQLATSSIQPFQGFTPHWPQLLSDANHYS